MQAFVPPVLLGMAGGDPLEADAQPQPPDRERAQAVERVGRREGQAVVRPNGLRQTKLAEHPLERRDRQGQLGGFKRLTAEQIAGREVADGQGIAIAPIGEEELPLVVGTPQRIRLRGVGQRRAGERRPARAASPHQAVPIEDRMNRADGRTSQG